MIYIVRHGQTDWNVEKRYQGRQDIELNEVGRNQAREIKKELEGINFDVIISSPLKRAYETAKIITSGADIKTDDRLVERSNGDLEGRLMSEVFGLIDFNDPNEYRYNVENVTDFRKRIFSFFDDINEKYKDENILVVTHAGVCIYTRCYFEGEPENNDFSKYRPKNCEIIKYENFQKKHKMI